MTEQQHSSTPVPNDTSIIIVGTGFGGLGMAMRLKEKGHDDFVILERAQDVGGAWRDNDYPGVACDVPSHLYSFSFLPNPNWSRVYSPGGEIHEYLRHCAREAGLYPHIHFGAEMMAANWDDETGLWTVKTPLGVWRAPYLITAAGVLADAHLPEIPGLAEFSGKTFHSARWDHSVDLEGKRIGVVGSGASAIQIVPEMAKVASELVVFQRTAPYMIPRLDREYSKAEKRLFARDPSTIDDLRSEIFWFGEYAFAQRRAVPAFLAEAREMALGLLKEQVADEDLRAKLTPDYELGCKRVLISSAYYPTLTQDHVTLETSALARTEGGTAIAASGNTYDLDVLVFATGFEVTQPPFAQRIFGREGISLTEHWQRGMKACNSTSVAGFPNLFIIVGPNTGLGHHTMVYIIEAQIDYILGALDYARETGAKVLEARPEAEDGYTDRLRARAKGTVWLDGGCQSWYLDPTSGDLTVLWPDFAYAFRDENAQFEPEAYLTRTQTAVPA